MQPFVSFAFVCDQVSIETEVLLEYGHAESIPKTVAILIVQSAFMNAGQHNKCAIHPHAFDERRQGGEPPREDLDPPAGAMGREGNGRPPRKRIVQRFGRDTPRPLHRGQPAAFAHRKARQRVFDTPELPERSRGMQPRAPERMMVEAGLLGGFENFPKADKAIRSKRDG